MERRGGTLRDATGVLRGAVAGDDLDAGVGSEPRCERIARPIREDVHRAAALELYEDRVYNESRFMDYHRCLRPFHDDVGYLDGIRRLDIGVDAHPSSEPFSYHEVAALMQSRRYQATDHHKERYE